MATLHVLAHSPFGDDRLSSCLRLLGAADGLLLTGDAVYALLPASEAGAKLAALGTPLFALQEDLAARGLSGDLPPGVQAVDYPGFVALCTQFERVNSWL